MSQAGRRRFLIEYLKKEDEKLRGIEIPQEDDRQRKLLRSLMNIRPAYSVSKEFISVQDAYLQEELERKGVVHLSELSPVKPGIYLWQGDITRLSVDAIVNAANREMLGCFIPCHACIDNAIHSAAGVLLRLECLRIMEKQDGPEPTGRAKITKGYNLACRHVLHTVGPVICGDVTEKDCELLADCYTSCLALAADYHLKSVAFCCISTGEFHFPAERAAKIAVHTVFSWLENHNSGMEVVFNVFKDSDYEIYKRFL
ncbi:MAG: protein-ADP-ribose hydrolase [Lachnospiraceae bacterium]|nr:protein-ADP-ribose hydrolase [Lachnospiraceae bacterium]